MARYLLVKAELVGNSQGSAGGLPRLIIHSDNTGINLSSHQSATLPQTAVLHLEQQGDEPLEFYLIELGVSEAQL